MDVSVHKELKRESYHSKHFILEDVEIWEWNLLSTLKYLAENLASCVC